MSQLVTRTNLNAAHTFTTHTHTNLLYIHTGTHARKRPRTHMHSHMYERRHARARMQTHTKLQAKTWSDKFLLQKLTFAVPLKINCMYIEFKRHHCYISLCEYSHHSACKSISFTHWKKTRGGGGRGGGCIYTCFTKTYLKSTLIRVMPQRHNWRSSFAKVLPVNLCLHLHLRNGTSKNVTGCFSFPIAKYLTKRVTREIGQTKEWEMINNKKKY